jgi:hypothetical protein
MDQIDNADTTNEPMFSTAILAVNKLDTLGVLLILNAVIENQVGVVAVLNQRCDKLP